MKKVIYSVLLLLLVSILFNACALPSEDAGTETTSSFSGAVTTKAPQNKREYTSIACREITSFAQTHFVYGDNDLVLSLWLPSDWELHQMSGCYQILRDETAIGRIYPGGVPSGDNNTCMDYRTQAVQDIAVTTYVTKTEDSPSGYTRCFCYPYMGDSEENAIILEADYAEIGDSAAEKLIVTCESAATVFKSGADSFKAYQSNRRDAVLILGNSFINSSRIGSILESMIQAGGKNTTVEAVSRGYASVQSYVESGDYLTRIQNGEYGVVFMCGFYSDGAVDSLESIVDVCRSSGTVLVIFPAHNESSRVIEKACSRWADDTLFLDWRGEINELIANTDATDMDMCIQDQHKHSTAMAGFVGAHMIYRAIYEDIPPDITTQAISTREARELLGSYVDTGWIR